MLKFNVRARLTMCVRAFALPLCWLSLFYNITNVSELSKETGLKLYTVQKILKVILAKSDLLKAERGVYGGYTLKKNQTT